MRGSILVGHCLGLGAGLALLTAAGCELDPEVRPYAPAVTATGGSVSNNPDAAVSEGFLADAGYGWKTLLLGHWEVPASTETYLCVRYTLPEDVSVSGLRPITPLGTHHTVLSIADDSKPDGATKCDATTNGRRSIAATGFHTNDLQLPDGVGLELKAGQQLLLNLHLFNVNDEALSGTSGALVRLIAPEDLEERAETILAGTVKLDLPANERTTQRGTCTMQGDHTLFAIAPHMHQLGAHLKAVAHSSVDGDVTLHDGVYKFDEQFVYPIGKQVHMKKGDKLDIDCTYQNTTPRTVNFGDSSTAEMCFAGIYRYPLGSEGSFICVK
ncbi:MAG: hypothetical protein RL701_7911 [Pseudomonadota bacterium]